MKEVSIKWEFEPTNEEYDAILVAKDLIQEQGLTVNLIGGRPRGRG